MRRPATFFLTLLGTLCIFSLWSSSIGVAQYPYGAALRALDAKLRQVENELRTLSATVNRLNSDLSSTSDRMKKVEDTVTQLNANNGKVETALAEARSIRAGIADAALADAGAKLDIVNHYVTIFGVFLAILVALATVSGYIYKSAIEERITKSAERRVNASIDADLKIARELTVAQMHSRLSFTYYRNYAAAFEGVVRGTTPTNPADTTKLAADARIAKDFATSGYRMLIDLRNEFVQMAADQRWRTVQAQLANLRLYNYSAELLCKRAGGEPIDNDEFLRLRDYWEECLSIADEEPVRSQTLWFEMHDSAAFAMVQFGNPQVQARGRRLIADICAGRTGSRPAPSPERIAAFRQEYAI